MSIIPPALRSYLRRRRLRASVSCCPDCRSEQVQLTEWVSNPARWKCRRCGLVWWQDEKDKQPVSYGQ